MMKTNKTTLAVMIASCFGSGLTMAQETQDAGKVLSPVVVTATRVEQDSFDLPMAIDKVEKSDLDNKLRMTLSESLSKIPGITAQFRGQMAQDPQISSRGFGARSSFGVRGIRLYIDGIPLSMPDGIGNPGSIDLDAIAGIEVMRGPFSAMYGTSSGGVIQLLTEKAPDTPTIGADVMYGSYDTRRESIRAAGAKNGVEYLVNYSDFSSDGYRLQSANEKRQATIKLGTKISDDSKLTTLISWFDQTAKDPLGLRRTGQSANNPGAFPGAFYNFTGVPRGALDANTRVIRSNTQVGFNFEKTIDSANTLNLITYYGQRDNLQYLSVPSGNDFTPGRASSISRQFYGIDARITNKGELIDRPYTLTYGLNSGYMEDDRLDRPTSRGVISGTATRDENQTALNIDQYAQGLWSVAERWDIHAGVRHTRLKLSIRPNSNASQSPTAGNLSFDKTTPVMGIVFKATPVLNLYANVGKGYETPTLVEVTYKSTTSSAAGPNLDLQPSSSTNVELGSKWMVSDNTRLNAAVFKIETEKEIVVSGTSTYTVYNNAGKTNRQGLELSAESLLPNNFSVYGAYTYLDAKFDESSSFRPGKVIPGTYRQQVYVEGAWKYQPLNFQTAIEGRYNSRVWVDDANTDSAPSYGILSVRASFQQESGRWRFTEYARVDNIQDKKYIGSVRVNDSNSRFFEPAPGRNWIVGVKANYAF